MVKHFIGLWLGRESSIRTQRRQTESAERWLPDVARPARLAVTFPSTSCPTIAAREMRPHAPSVPRVVHSMRLHTPPRNPPRDRQCAPDLAPDKAAPRR